MLLLLSCVLCFASDGNDGDNGINGQQGQDGISSSFVAGIRPLKINLSGENGKKGANGKNGEDGSFCEIAGFSPHDIIQPNGGNGGSGGHGGDGGNGGDVYVFYKNIKYLKNLTLDISPGRGAAAGQRGYGGRACSCNGSNMWTREFCRVSSSSAKRVCSTEFFHCTDGRNGQNGSNGKQGGNGKYGNLFLVKNRFKLSLELLQRKVKFSDIINKAIAFRQHIWHEKKGSKQLLAPTSKLKNNYYQYVKTKSIYFRYVWRSKLAPANYQQTILLKAHDGVVSGLYPKDLWVISNISRRGNLISETINDIIKVSEINSLDLKIHKQGRHAKITITDNSIHAHKLRTKFKLLIKSPRLFSWKIIYNAEVPTDAILRQGENYLILIDKLSINKKYFDDGRRINIKLTAQRLINNYKKEFTFELKHTFKDNQEDTDNF